MRRQRKGGGEGVRGTHVVGQFDAAVGTCTVTAVGGHLSECQPSSAVSYTQQLATSPSTPNTLLHNPTHNTIQHTCTPFQHLTHHHTTLRTTPTPHTPPHNTTHHSNTAHTTTQHYAPLQHRTDHHITTQHYTPLHQNTRTHTHTHAHTRTRMHTHAHAHAHTTTHHVGGRCRIGKNRS